ncbi:MAG: hypothetical protein QW506_01825 [Thermoproteota archaeon]
MIKTWMIPIVASTIIMASLLMVNLTVQSGSILLADLLKQRTRLVLADSLAKDIFSSVENIAEASMSSSQGNFSEFKKNLMDKMERFKTENLHEECFKEHGIIVQFDYTIETREEEFSVEIVCRIRVSDSEGFFEFERIHNTVKRQDSTG